MTPEELFVEKVLQEYPYLRRMCTFAQDTQGLGFILELWGKQQWNAALDEVLKLTYEQTLESGAKVDVIERTDIIKLKK